MFSFNGLDYIAHERHLQALAEIKRVLRPQGLFLFCSHNRNPLSQPRTASARNRQLSVTRSCMRFFRRVLLRPRHWRVRRHEVATAEYAIVNDSGLNFRC
jgi:hypothetical protein